MIAYLIHDTYSLASGHLVVNPVRSDAVEILQAILAFTPEFDLLWNL